MEVTLQAAEDESAFQRDAADQARFDLAEAKDKTKDLDSRIYAQQRSLEDKDSRLNLALSAETQIRQDLIDLRIEVHSNLSKAEDLETQIAAKDAR